MTSIHTATATMSAAGAPGRRPRLALRGRQRAAAVRRGQGKADPPAPREALVAKVGVDAGRATARALVVAARD